ARAAVAASTSPVEAQLLLVDEDILRSVTLGSSLQRAGWIWRLQPQRMAENELEALWPLAKPGSGYDMFLSHTWLTPGPLKFRSLLLAFNWHYALLGCFLGGFMALLLYAFDAAPMPMIYVAQFKGYGEVCALGPWALLLTPLCGASALLLSPYLPRHKSVNVFFDLVCIHQTNTDLKHRGIYGIGGFLSVTEELRILWSPPYLSGGVDRPLMYLSILATTEAQLVRVEPAKCPPVSGSGCELRAALVSSDSCDVCVSENATVDMHMPGERIALGELDGQEGGHGNCIFINVLMIDDVEGYSAFIVLAMELLEEVFSLTRDLLLSFSDLPPFLHPDAGGKSHFGHGAIALSGCCLSRVFAALGQVWVQIRLKRRCGWIGIRVGEASHPGPGSATTARKRFEGQNGAIITMLLQFLLQMLQGGGDPQQMLQQALGMFGLHGFGGGQATGPAGGPSGRKKKKKRKLKYQPSPPLGGGPSSVVGPIGSATSGPQQSGGRGKGKGSDQLPKDAKGKGKGNSNVTRHASSWRIRSQDWTAAADIKFVEAGLYANSVGNKQTAVVQAQDLPQVSETLASNRGKEAAPLTVVLPVMPGIFVESLTALRPDAKVVRARIPGREDGKLLQKECWVIRIGDDAPKLAHGQVASARTSLTTTRPSVVLRLSTVAPYCTKTGWQDMRKSPAIKARAWVQGVLQDGRGVQDTWGWAVELQSRGEVITGLLRVSPAAARHLISASGRTEQGNAIFVEPLRWDAPLDGEASKPPAVDWVERHGGEEDNDYLKRVVALSSHLGVARGSAQLGVRRPRKSEEGGRVRAWSIGGVPRQWQTDDVTGLLQEVGFDHITLQRKTVNRKGASWSFRAGRPDARDYLDVQVGDATFFAAVMGSTPKPRKTTPLQFERVQYVQGGKPGSKGTLRVPIVNIDAEAPVVQAAKKQRTDAIPDGMTKVDIAKDGNCLFASIAMGVTTAAQPRTAAQIRAACVGAMQRHPRRFETSWDGREPTSGEKTIEAETGKPPFSVYLDMLAKEGSWGGALETAAIALAIKRTVVVLGPTLQQAEPIVYNRGAAGDPVVLWFEGRHYDLLRGALPGDILQAAQPGDWTGHRGGGDVGDDLSEITCFTPAGQGVAVAEAVEEPAESEITAASFGNQGTVRSSSTLVQGSLSQLWGRGGSRGSAAIDAAAGVASSSRPGGSAAASATTTTQDIGNINDFIGEEQVDIVPPPPAPVGAKRARKWQPKALKTNSGWKCSECGYSTGVSKYWPQRKQAHVDRFHPELREELSMRLRRIGMVPYNKDTCIWKCPACDKGLPNHDASDDTRLQARRQHAETEHPDLDISLFLLKPSTAGAAKATNVVKAAGVASRLQEIKTGKGGNHTVELVRLPATPGQSGKKRRNALVYALCARCAQLSLSVARLGAMPCRRTAQGAKRPAFIKRLKAARDGASVTQEVLDGIKRTLEVIDADAATVIAEQAEEEEPAEHELHAVAWPGAEGYSIKFLCVRCQGAWSDERGARPVKCNFGGRRYKKKRNGDLRALSEAGGVAGHTAADILRLLGEPLEDAGGDGARQTLAAGFYLGGGGGGPQAFRAKGWNLIVGPQGYDTKGASRGGVAILTDWPAQEIEVPATVVHDHRVMAARVHRPGRPPFLVVNLYLPANDDMLNQAIISKVCEWVQQMGCDFIMLGDWNRLATQQPLVEYLSSGRLLAADNDVFIQSQGTRRNQQGHYTGRTIDYGVHSCGLWVGRRAQLQVKAQTLRERRLRRAARRAWAWAGGDDNPDLERNLRRDVAALGRLIPSLLDYPFGGHELAQALLDEAAKEAERASKARVQEWKGSVVHDIAKAARWVRGSEQERPVNNVTDDPHPQARAGREAHRWSAVWEAQARPDGRALEGLLADLPRDDLRAVAPSLRVTAAALLRRARASARKAAGTDGWSGAHFSTLPLGFYEGLAAIWTLILEDAPLPSAWLQVRTALINKADGGVRIAFQPIFVENLILKSFFGIAAIQGTYLATLQFPTVRGLAGIQVLVCFGLILPLIQVVRSFMREKHVAIWQLENFDLTMVDCKNEFDRRFVYDAIRKWYGSEENFEQFVQGRLCEELIERFRVIEVPWVYHLLTVCPYLGGWVDITCALWKGGAPSSCVLSFGIGMCLTCGVWALVAVELIYILSDFFAAKRKSCLGNLMVDVGILICVGLLVLLQTTASRLAYGAAPFTTPPQPESAASPDASLCTNSIWTSAALLALVLLIAVLFFKSSLRRRTNEGNFLDTGEISVPLVKEHPPAAFILFAILMSVSLGVMILGEPWVAEAQNNDEAQKLKVKDLERTKNMEELAKLCAGLDDDGNGLMSLEEILNGFDSMDGFQRLMESMDIRREEIETIFSVLDSENTGAVPYLDFCTHLGGFRKRDPIVMHSIVKYKTMQIQSLIQKEVMGALQQQTRMLQEQYRLLANLTVLTAGANQSPNESVNGGEPTENQVALSRVTSSLSDVGLPFPMPVGDSESMEIFERLERRMQPLLLQAEELAREALAGRCFDASKPTARPFEPGRKGAPSRCDSACLNEDILDEREHLDEHWMLE
ncbi:unnamed protein product, partial [Symbiodinium sp. CCMP2456]